MHNLVEQSGKQIRRQYSNSDHIFHRDRMPVQGSISLDGFVNSIE